MKNKELMEKELNRIEEILTSINEIAQKDGTITDDEKAILEMIDRDLKEYQKILSKELSHGGEISTTTLNTLRKYKNKIFEHARNIAASDGRFYEDEWHILEKLHELVE
jgi:hypothetical protein